MELGAGLSGIGQLLGHGVSEGVPRATAGQVKLTTTETGATARGRDRRFVGAPLLSLPGSSGSGGGPQHGGSRRRDWALSAERPSQPGANDAELLRGAPPDPKCHDDRLTSPVTGNILDERSGAARRGSPAGSDGMTNWLRVPT